MRVQALPVCAALVFSASMAGSAHADVHPQPKNNHTHPVKTMWGVLHNWDAVAQCESSGNWHIATGNGYYGGLQFNLRTWHAYGGLGNPALAPKWYQIMVAERVLQHQGINAWPVCGPRLYGLPARKGSLIPIFHLPPLGKFPRIPWPKLGLRHW